MMAFPSTSKDADKICTLCNRNISKYCCPRCDALYCSLTCYKSEKHFRCSEEFYKECITKELEDDNVDEDSKRKMVEILQRVHQQDEYFPQSIEEILADIDENDINLECQSDTDSDDEELEALKKRMAGINLERAEEVWYALSEDEKNEFAALISEGNIDKILDQWKPWWGFTREKQMVEEVGSEKNDKLESEALAKCPPLKEMPQLSQLTSVKPAPTIKFNIINVIASYAFIMRYFNGDTDPVDGAIHILEICENLSSNTNFQDPRFSIESIVQKCIQSQFIESDQESLDVMKHDILLILNGPSKANKSYYCKAALSDVLNILTKAKTQSKTQISSENSSVNFYQRFSDRTDYLPTLNISQVKKCIKKVEYYLSFVQSYGVVNPV